MKTWRVIAFLLFIVASVIAGLGKSWPVCAVAGGLAAELVPVVFDIT